MREGLSWGRTSGVGEGKESGESGKWNISYILIYSYIKF